MASDVEGLYAAVKALVCVVKSNPLASKEMERIRGYQVCKKCPTPAHAEPVSLSGLAVPVAASCGVVLTCLSDRKLAELCVPNPQGLDTVCSAEQMVYELRGVMMCPFPSLNTTSKLLC